MLVLPFCKNLGHQVEGTLWQSTSGDLRMDVPHFLAVIWRNALFVYKTESPLTPLFYVDFFNLCFTFISLPSDKIFQPRTHLLTPWIAFSHSSYFPQGSHITFSCAAIPLPSFQIRIWEQKLSRTPQVCNFKGKRQIYLSLPILKWKIGH